MLEAELLLARELADRTAEVAMAAFRRGPQVRFKRDRTPVTEADLAVEELIRKEIAATFPDDAVHGEEGGLGGDASRVWIVDPIDGTKNFAAGIQVWGTLIALAVDGEPLLGVVSAPALAERYEAVRGGGARLNGEPIRVSDTPTLARATLAHPSLTDWPAEGRHGILSLLGEARRAVGFGDFWGHCLVARGAADAMAEPALRIWDWAAIRVVVEEAGGRMTSWDGGPCTDGGPVLTTNGRLHDEVVSLLRTHKRNTPPI